MQICSESYITGQSVNEVSKLIKLVHQSSDMAVKITCEAISLYWFAREKALRLKALQHKRCTH